MAVTASNTHQSPTRFIWVEYIKASALLWIFLNHVTEIIFGSPQIANPSMYWSPLGERIAQLHPFQGNGILDIPLNLTRYVGWMGDQGVQLFIIISGFGLTWGLLARHSEESLPFGSFYRHRAVRIYPLWWISHVFFLPIALFTGRFGQMSLTNSSFYFSLLGIRITPEQLYYFSPAWWYFGLLVQLYLVYPLLWRLLCRFGAWKLLLWGGGIAFLIRGAGLVLIDAYLPSYLDAWSRGAIFITRLPEFLFGMSLAYLMYKRPDQLKHILYAPSTLLLAVIIYAAGIVLSLFLWGMTFAPFMLGLGVFVFLYALFSRTKRTGLGVWVGQHSYALYLTHHSFILALVPVGTSNLVRTGGNIVIALFLTVIIALLFERVETEIMKWYKQVGFRRLILRLGMIFVVGMILIFGSEVLVRQLNPQESNGWGERASLEPNEMFGWRLKPDTVTHLRWKSYDYTVTANSLGFPGPEYSVEKPDGAIRILVTGDAFSSAEGVDTNQAWPRLLENELAAQFLDRPVEVMNFAITGYGPEQYAAVIAAYAPLYNPDLIIIESFVNDYDDVLLSTEEFQQSIGFQQAPQDSLVSYLSLDHLRTFIRSEVIPTLFHTNDPDGYFFSYISILERNQPDLIKRQQAVLEYYKKIQTVATSIGAPVILLMIPASSQVCTPADLAYFPSDVDLSNSNRFDLDLPQRITKEIADTLDWDFYDLRIPLRNSSEGCPYTSYNLHWLPFGHEVVARFVDTLLISNGYLPQLGETSP
ncbi:MAG: acyltransferase [Anaerolineaceae bacterium]|nr:acyltransferase [Anaerolineaceae bacterium]